MVYSGAHYSVTGRVAARQPLKTLRWTVYRLSSQLRLNQLQIALTFGAFGLTDHVGMIGMIAYARW